MGNLALATQQELIREITVRADYNPTLVDLSLATTQQLVDELMSRFNFSGVIAYSPNDNAKFQLHTTLDAESSAKVLESCLVAFNNEVE